MNVLDDSFIMLVDREDLEASVEKGYEDPSKQKGGIIKIRVSKNNEVPIDLI